ncbi:Transporter major facilitator family protein [Trichostrongylus colubriformis]|uniref:Transporter major facilitator family protein n=1 Tax=Trichostrongylus colubriformis TaxID=6319 RepID=A0AAN8F2D2_TRICO
MNYFRYVILLISTLSITFIYSNRIVFGFTVICQVPENNTRTDYYLAQPVAKAWMFTATAIGMCLGPIPLHWVYKYDTRILILIYGLISTFSSAFYPLFDSIGLWPSLASRFLAGFGQASHLHFSNEVVLVWAQEKEKSLFFSLLLSASQLGPLFTKILGGEMCASSFGWEATYYVLAFLTLTFTLIFAFIYTQDVKSNRFVSDEEVVMIITGRKKLEEVGAVPYRDLLSDVSIWTSLVMFIGYYIGMIIYQLYSPTFIKQVLHYSIRETGYFSAIPMLFAIFVKVAVGKSIDYGFGLSQKWRLAAPLVILESISALSIFLVGFIDNRVVSLAFNMLFASLHFFVPVICSRTIQIIGAQYAHIALNFNMFIAGFVQILIPGTIHLMVPDNTKEQWSHVFYCLAASIVTTTVLYVALVKVRPASWTTSKQEKASNGKKILSFSQISVKVN